MARLYLLLLLCVVSLSTVAAVDNATREKIEKRLHQSFPELKIDAVEQAPMKGFYEVAAGSEIYYLSNDLQYIFFGEVLDLNQEKTQWNVSENRRQKLRLNLIADIPKKDLVTYKAENKKTEIYIFTDIDCVFCQRIHKHIPDLVAAGIEVHYFAFPRRGINSENFKKMVSVWCAKDPQATLTAAKNGSEVKEQTCKNSVDEQYKLGVELGIRGTPTLLFADGAMAFGYMPVKQLISAAMAHKQF